MIMYIGKFFDQFENVDTYVEIAGYYRKRIFSEISVRYEKTIQIYGV